jgi:hypothetical protein
MTGAVLLASVLRAKADIRNIGIDRALLAKSGRSKT